MSGSSANPADDLSRAMQAALRLLGQKDRSQADLAARLSRRGFPRAIVAEVVAKLARAGYADDARVAREAAEAELRRSPAAERFVRAKVLRTGVAPQQARTAARQAAEGSTEAQRALVLAQQWRRRYPTVEGAAAWRRLLGVLARRGFTEDVAMSAAEQVLGSQPEDGDGPAEYAPES